MQCSCSRHLTPLFVTTFQVVIFGRPPPSETGFAADGVLWLPWYLIPAGEGGGCRRNHLPAKSVYIAWREHFTPKVLTRLVFYLLLPRTRFNPPDESEPV